jgi:hypothetical protein
VSRHRTPRTNLRQVSTAEAEAYAKEARLLFFEASAKTGQNVGEVFTEIGGCLSIQDHISYGHTHPAPLQADTAVQPRRFLWTSSAPSPLRGRPDEAQVATARVRTAPMSAWERASRPRRAVAAKRVPLRGRTLFALAFDGCSCPSSRWQLVAKLSGVRLWWGVQTHIPSSRSDRPESSVGGRR